MSTDKRASNTSKRMSEWCERKSKQTIKWPSSYIWILGCSGPQWTRPPFSLTRWILLELTWTWCFWLHPGMWPTPSVVVISVRRLIDWIIPDIFLRGWWTLGKRETSSCHFLRDTFFRKDVCSWPFGITSTGQMRLLHRINTGPTDGRTDGQTDGHDLW